MDNREENNIENGEELDEELGIVKTPEMLALEEPGETPTKERMSIAEYLFEWLEILAGALTLVMLLFTFIVRIVTVEGASMQETLHEKDRLVISHWLEPKQNDIVVIQVPNSSFTTPIIKRVIATEGQTVDFDFENWTVIVDGEELDEPYVNRVDGSMYSIDIALDSLPLTIEPGKIFVMGDNRNRSADSRDSRIGQVDVNNVVGRVLVRWFPFDRLGTVNAHEE